MSHMSLIKLSIVNPNMEILKAAMEQVAKQFGARLTTTVKDGYGHTRTVAIGFKGDRFPYGVGVNVGKNGQVTLVGDTRRLSEVENALTVQYSADALTVALKEDGWQVVQRTAAHEILLEAEAF